MSRSGRKYMTFLLRSSAGCGGESRIRGGLITDYGSDAGVDAHLATGRRQFVIIARATPLDHT
jgi:hypothetical protein